MDAGDGSDTRGSRRFLEDDLARGVRGSGRPVLIYSHGDPFESDVEEDEVNRWFAILNYNVVGVFAGHTHALQRLSWWGEMNVYQDGTLGMLSGPTGNFLVVHLGGTHLVVAEWTQTNSCGAVGSQTIQCPTGICMVTDPQSTNVTAGTDVKLTVEAAGPALEYQCVFNGTNAIAGATNNALRLSSVSAAEAGSYTAVVSNQRASVATAPAVLSVQPRAKAGDSKSIPRQPEGGGW